MDALPACGVIGPGRLGRTLALALHERGCLRWLKGRSPGSAEWARRHGIPYVLEWQQLEPVEVVWLTVPDRALAELAGECARAGMPWIARSVVVHCAGALGVEPLNACAEVGAETAVAHPFQTFPLPAQPQRLHCGPWSIEARTPKAARVLAELVRALEGIPVFVQRSPQQRALYHAAAVAASNLLVAVLKLAEELARGSGIPPTLFLEPIVRASVENYFAAVGAIPLTGPVVRADWETLRRHWEALPEPLRAPYRHALLLLAEVARSEGLLSEAQQRELHSLLGVV
jgi:predicted short-subunit dehydrogenase-like oxidoreductase (DUF2520 family)